MCWCIDGIEPWDIGKLLDKELNVKMCGRLNVDNGIFNLWGNSVEILVEIYRNKKLSSFRPILLLN